MVANPWLLTPFAIVAHEHTNQSDSWVHITFKLKEFSQIWFLVNKMHLMNKKCTYDIYEYITITHEYTYTEMQTPG